MKSRIGLFALLCGLVLCQAGCEAVFYSDGTRRFAATGLFTQPSVQAAVGADGSKSVLYQRSNDAGAMGVAAGAALRAFTGGVPALTPALPAPATLPLP